MYIFLNPLDIINLFQNIDLSDNDFPAKNFNIS